MDALVEYDVFALARNRSLILRMKPFSEKLIDYFSLYWESHQWTEQDMNAPNKSPIELQERSLPIFHGMVFCTNDEDQTRFKNYIKDLFGRHFMPFDRFWNNTLFNNSGEFSLINLWEETRTIEQILAGRTYDLVFLMNIEPQGDMLSTIANFTKDNDPSRVIIIKETD